MFARNVRSGQLCQIAEYDGKDCRRQQGLYDCPKRSQDRLFVACIEIPLDEQEDQVAVMKRLSDVEIK